jgi:hypothetical protein
MPSLPTHAALAVQRVNVIIDVSIDADKELDQEKLQRGCVGVAKVVNTEVTRSVNGERVPTCLLTNFRVPPCTHSGHLHMLSPSTHTLVGQMNWSMRHAHV